MGRLGLLKPRPISGKAASDCRQLNKSCSYGRLRDPLQLRVTSPMEVGNGNLCPGPYE
jgi:hypothetical protein